MEGVRIKLISAQRADGPRWGDYYEKLDLKYLSNLIENGIWFDGSQIFKMVTQSHESDYAPEYILANSDKFKSLLVPPNKS